MEALNPGLDLLAQQLFDAKIHSVASVVAPSLSDKVELFEGAWSTDLCLGGRPAQLVGPPEHDDDLP